MENRVKCFISGKNISADRAIKGSAIRETLFEFINSKYPEFGREDYLSRMAYDKMRHDYLLNILKFGDEVVTSQQKEVVDAITRNEVLSENIEPILDDSLSFGDKAADKIAEFGGSWRFIIIFFTILLIWISINVVMLTKHPFDPYPFILLNLILSCLAAIQAPIIMMSQNRVEQKDRLRSENDYKINLKAELEIKLLHEKIDNLTFKQNRQLLEIQQLQIEFLNDILKSHTDKK